MESVEIRTYMRVSILVPWSEVMVRQPGIDGITRT